MNSTLDDSVFVDADYHAAKSGGYATPGAAAVQRRRNVEAHMANGVTFLDPENVYVDTDASATVSRGDVRISVGSGGFSVGSIADDVAESDWGNALTTIAANRVEYRDVNSNGVFEKGEGLYIDNTNIGAVMFSTLDPATD